MILRTLTDQLPTATIQFKTAEGIEAGKTKIKYKSVDIGIVNEIAFAEDFSNVIVTAEFNEGLDDFLRRNTRFWVVRPQLSVRGVSGLGTLISGAYIEIDPGPGAIQTHFVGLEEIPLITTDDAGKRITLITKDLGSLGRGSPIYYQGLLAGEVLGYELAGDAKSVYVHGFVRDPFDQLVQGNSRFWNVSGLDVSMGADGFDVKTASVTSLLFGGVAFSLWYLPYYFYPYYFLLALAGFYHATNGLRTIAARNGIAISRSIQINATVIAAIWIAVSLLSFGGVLVPVENPADNDFARLLGSIWDADPTTPIRIFGG